MNCPKWPKMIAIVSFFHINLYSFAIFKYALKLKFIFIYMTTTKHSTVWMLGGGGGGGTGSIGDRHSCLFIQPWAEDLQGDWLSHTQINVCRCRKRQTLTHLACLSPWIREIEGEVCVCAWVVTESKQQKLLFQSTAGTAATRFTAVIS